MERPARLANAEAAVEVVRAAVRRRRRASGEELEHALEDVPGHASPRGASAAFASLARPSGHVSKVHVGRMQTRMRTCSPPTKRARSPSSRSLTGQPRSGIGVFKPLTDGERYDLILDIGPLLRRSQCKWARRLERRRCHPLLLGPTSARRAERRGSTAQRKSTRSLRTALISIACFLLSADRLRRTIRPLQLRLSPSRNNQQLRINWADDFDFDARLGALLGP